MSDKKENELAELMNGENPLVLILSLVTPQNLLFIKRRAINHVRHVNNNFHCPILPLNSFV